MIRYLKGEHPENIWSGAPIDAETVPLLEPLIRINELGIISLEGQPGTFLFPKTHYKTRETYAEYQHGYLVGLMHSSKLPYLQRMVIADPDVCLVSYVFSSGMVSILNAPTEQTDTPFGKGIFVKTTEYGKDYVLTGQLYTDPSNTSRIRKITSTTSHSMTDISELALADSIEHIRNKTLYNELYTEWAHITLIHNKVGTFENPTNGLGLEGKIIEYLTRLTEEASEPAPVPESAVASAEASSTGSRGGKSITKRRKAIKTGARTTRRNHRHH